MDLTYHISHGLITNHKMLSEIKRQELTANNAGEITMEKIEAPMETKKPKKGDAGEDDLDIGDEMPMSSFSPVDRAGSSWSSDSSSSSDSDSGSSSGSDSDAR